MNQYLKMALLTTCFFSVFVRSHAQEKTEASFTISTEITSPILGGFVADLGYNFGKNRISTNFSFLPEIPFFYNPQSDEFTANRYYIDVFYTRFLNDSQDGFHYGVGLGYVFDETVNLIDTDLEAPKDYWKTGVRLGYLWHPFKKKKSILSNFFLEPAFYLGFALNEKDVTLANKTFNASPIKLSGPLFNLGYKF